MQFGKLVLVAVVCALATGLFVAACSSGGGGGSSGDDDSGGGDDDSGGGDGSFCSGFCDKIYECGGQEVLDENGYSTVSDCVDDCAANGGNSDSDAQALEQQCPFSETCGDWLTCSCDYIGGCD
jgi:hypothetical protein